MLVKSIPNHEKELLVNDTDVPIDILRATSNTDCMACVQSTDWPLLNGEISGKQLTSLALHFPSANRGDS